MGGILAERIWEVKDKIRKIGGMLQNEGPHPFSGKVAFITSIRFLIQRCSDRNALP